MRLEKCWINVKRENVGRGGGGRELEKRRKGRGEREGDGKRQEGKKRKEKKEKIDRVPKIKRKDTEMDGG